ncbi:two component transcriptional regulator, winged helix family [Hymenobacter gelipurpurascens]|uniref:Two component transcriptional regulator, winged helix family n=1 Tax=Hymenobacter gelipurpurascens TaxID=89968 RepID=A0A212TQI3_9BACT|nr:response regulator transcription factor [Hymenobacter gelipurpurascens]SNC68287.1 two component transcriptional regulator, winged helix family [Hymenobacter gelipurpurascens]
MTVLIVEDERTMARELGIFLHQQSFVCTVARTAREASEQLADNGFDFVLLDLGLPGGDGLDVLAEAKQNDSTAAFIILTARGSVEDRIRGLELGADDYLAKPFSLPELLARMHAITRRRFGLNKPLVACGEFELDVQNRRLLHQHQEVSLSVKEFDVLSYLVLHRNRVLTRLQLTEHIWGNLPESGFDSNYIDAHIKNLRKKLGQYADVTWLETVRGLGYRAVLPK